MLIVLIILFFTHGMLYFIYPTEMNNPTSFIKYIKYIIILFFISSFSYKSIKIKDVILIFSLISILLLFFLINDSSGLNNIFILFSLPISFMYLYRKKFDNIELILKSAIYIYIAVSIFAYLEHIIFSEIFSKFSHGSSGYRGSSILVNPNNFGITIVFIFVFIYENLNKKLLKSLFFINTVVMVYFSMSKTAIIILFVYLVFKYFKLLIPLLLIIPISILLFVNININEKYLASLNARGEYNYNFLELANNNIIFPFINSYQYTDNIYFQVWGTFGIFVLIMFFIFNQVIVIRFFILRKYLHSLVILCFLLVGITTNYLYLWPLSYMYWGFIFITIDNITLQLSKKIK